MDENRKIKSSYYKMKQQCIKYKFEFYIFDTEEKEILIEDENNGKLVKTNLFLEKNSFFMTKNFDSKLKDLINSSNKKYCCK